MTHPTISIIHREHGTLSGILRTITLVLNENKRRCTLPDFNVLRAMLFYVDEFAERLHHTKESELLFPRIRAHSAELAGVLDRLDSDHDKSEQAIRDLEHELLGFEMMSDSFDGTQRRARFEKSMQDYIDAYLVHMSIEEREVLPVAERVLNATDWAELDAAFMKNRDPLTQREPDDAYRPLFVRILKTLPAPIRVGSVVAALAGSRQPAQGPRS
jgi:hemerythrin-like domain-containing protein